MIINHNMSAINAQRQMYKTSTSQSKATEKLSSGLRINRAGDDAAGLAISEKMRGQISGLNQASRNAQDSISLIQTAEGALDEQHSMLQRMRELAVQAENDTNTDSDREQIQSEINQLQAEITAITDKTEFNTKKLLNGDQKATSVSSELKMASADKKMLSVDKKMLSAEIKQVSVDTKQASINTKTKSMETKLASVETKLASAEARMAEAEKAATEGSAAIIKASASKIKVSAAKLKATATNIQGSIDKMKGSMAKIQGSMEKIKGSAEKINAEIEALRKDSEKILEKNIQEGTSQGGLTFQVGANAGQSISVGIGSMTAKDLGVDTIDVTKQGSDNLAKIDKAINMVSTQRSKLGAIQNRLEHTIANVDNSAENLQSSESRIRDTDMAKEMMNLTSKNVLSQATQAMLAQANQKPNQVLSLLQ